MSFEDRSFLILFAVTFTLWWVVRRREPMAVALLVVSGDASMPAWSGRLFDLRVEDHEQPLVEMRRLLNVARAYRLMNDGDAFLADGEVERASEAYSAASKLLPDSHETVFWHAVTLAGAGRADVVAHVVADEERLPGTDVPLSERGADAFE